MGEDPDRVASQAVLNALPENGVDIIELGKDGLIIMNMCGRGDKDVFTIADALGEHISEGTNAENTKAY